MTVAGAPAALSGPAWDDGDSGSTFDPAEYGLTPGDAGLDDPFYQPPTNLPPAGQIVKSEPAQHLLELTGRSWPGSATKIMYSSTNELGATVGVTGFVIEPTVPWAGPGERPTIAIAPGTMGQGDQCAPSAQDNLFATFDESGEPVGLNFELMNAYLAASNGVRVVVTDYIGLGTPGVHTYVNSVDEGNALIDAARAALTLTGAPADSPVGFFGYSQGGGAAASAAERVSGYAPDLNVTATFAGAPPANLREVLPSIDGGALFSTLGYAVNSALEYRPELAYLIGEHLNEEGIRFLQETRTSCSADSMLGGDGEIDITQILPDPSTMPTTNHLTKTGESFSDLLDRLPEVGAYLDAQKLGSTAPSAPILVQNGVNDDALPIGQSRQLAADYCAQGGHVTFYPNQVPEIRPGSGIGHMLPMVTDLPLAHSFLLGSFLDVELPNNCGQF